MNSSQAERAFLRYLEKLKSQPASVSPTKPKTVKRKAPKKERPPKIDTTFLKARGQWHVRELIAEFFPNGHQTKGGYWITPEFRISLSTGCFWENIQQRPGGRPIGDVLTLFLIGHGFLTPAKPLSIPEGLSKVEELKLRIANSKTSSRTPGYEFPEKESFAKGVEAFSTSLEQFSAKSEIHELVAYDS